MLNAARGGCAAVPPNLIVCDRHFLWLLHSLVAAQQTVTWYAPSKKYLEVLNDSGRLFLPLSAELIRTYLSGTSVLHPETQLAAMIRLRQLFMSGELTAPASIRFPYAHFFIEAVQRERFGWSFTGALSVIIAHEFEHLMQTRSGGFTAGDQGAPCRIGDTSEEDSADQAAIDYVRATDRSIARGDKRENLYAAMLVLMTTYKEIVMFIGFDGLRTLSAERWRRHGWHSGYEGSDQVLKMLDMPEQQVFFERIAASIESPQHMNMLLRLDRYVAQSAGSEWSRFLQQEALVSWRPLYERLVATLCARSTGAR